MKVCVIIPVFNEQDFIKKSVESLIDQTIKPAEVIYVNDNSTDNSKNIIKTFGSICFYWSSYMSLSSYIFINPFSIFLNI